MATTTAEASGVGSTDNWTLAAGASKTVAVNSPDDDTTSYIQSGTTTNTYQQFTCSPAISSGDTITQIEVRARCRRGGANDCTFRIGYSFSPQGGGTQTNESGAGAMTAVNAWGGFTFTDSGLSVVWGSGLVFWIRNTQGRQLHCSTLNVTITFTPAAGGGVLRLTQQVRLTSRVGGQLAR